MASEREVLEAQAGTTAGSGADLERLANDEIIQDLTDRAAFADLVALTDSSTGTSGGDTVGAVSSTGTAANGIATLTEKVNEIVAVLVAFGTQGD